MRELTLSVVTCALLIAPHALAADACPVVEPGVSIGAVKIGMTLEQLKGLGVEVKQAHHEQNFYVGGLEVWLTDGEVTQIGADDSRVPCLTLMGAKVKIKEEPLEALGARYPKQCGAPTPAIGATPIECASGVAFYRHRGGVEARVVAQPRQPKIICDAYVAAGAVGHELVGAVDLTPGMTVCFGAMSLTTDVEVDDVASLYGDKHIDSCDRQANRGATILTCAFSGVRMIFAGPRLTLTRVEASPLKK